MLRNDTLLAGLRASLAEAALRGGRAAAAGPITFGTATLDAPLGGGIARAALHEVQAPGTSDLAAATGFAVGLALRAAQARPILWIRQDVLDAETGRLYPPGLVELGLDPSRILLVRARDAAGVLRAGAEAARCPALGTVLIEPWGEPRLLDLTASRRLALAAEASGVTTVLLRTCCARQPGAASTRWRVCALPSRAREAGAPGNPAFSLLLLRHRGGIGEREWHVEWSRERRSFQDYGALREQPARPADAAPLSRPVVPFPGDGQAAQAGRGTGLRQAG